MMLKSSSRTSGGSISPHVYDWNAIKTVRELAHGSFELFDETLRDGIQSPSALDPPLAAKLSLIHMMAELGIHAADLGLPAASERAYHDALALTQTIYSEQLPIKPACAARTLVKDIVPIADIAQRAGGAVEVYAFIGSSPIRMLVEEWTIDTLLRQIDESLQFALSENLPVCLVTEDTTRSRPEVLDRLFRHAISMGVRRLCLCDTVGHATPDGMSNLFQWTRSLLRTLDADVDVKIDWHGHNDRGLGVVNALYALRLGADRIHGTALGLGERVGNAALDQILVNLELLGVWPHNLERLVDYCELVSDACSVAIPDNYPLAGRDAFRTATGVHAAAIAKAQKKGEHYLADRVYSAVPAATYGRSQVIEIGPQSGMANVAHWLERRGIEFDPELARAILTKAKYSTSVLSEDEILALIGQSTPVIASPNDSSQSNDNVLFCA